MKIDKFLEGRNYFKRSDVINNLLAAVLENFTEREVYDMVCRYRWNRNVCETKFEITQVLKPLKPRD